MRIRGDFQVLLGEYLQWEFKEALSGFCRSNCAVALVNRTGMDSIIVEIDISRPFAEVIQELAEIMKKSK